MLLVETEDEVSSELFEHFSKIHNSTEKITQWYSGKLSGYSTDVVVNRYMFFSNNQPDIIVILLCQHYKMNTKL